MAEKIRWGAPVMLNSERCGTCEYWTGCRTHERISRPYRLQCESGQHACLKGSATRNASNQCAYRPSRWKPWHNL